MPTAMASLSEPAKKAGVPKKDPDPASSNNNNDTASGSSSLLSQMMGAEKKRKKDEQKAKSEIGGLHVAGADKSADHGSAWDAAVNSVSKRDIVLANTEWEDSWIKEANPDGGRRKIEEHMQRGKSLAALVAPVGMDLVRKKLAAENKGFTCQKDCGGIKFWVSGLIFIKLTAY